jgi:dTMP kinase
VQTNLLIERLRKEGFRAELFDFPQYGRQSAALVTDYLNGKYGDSRSVGPYRASIFFACDRYDASFRIRELLSQGVIVVCNRYVSANMGHQAGKIRDAAEREKFLEWLDDLEFGIFGIPKPDINLLLFMPPLVGQQLVDKKGSRDYVGGKKRDIHEQDAQHLIDAAEAFAYVAKKYSWPVINCAENDSPRQIEKIHEDVWAAVKKTL